MSQLTRERQTRKKPHTQSKDVARLNRRRISNPPSAELLESTRRLMEQSIHFVDDPLFHGSDAENRISELCPKSADTRADREPCEPGLAFVTGLVETPLLTPEGERYRFLQMNYLKYLAEQTRRQLDLRHPSHAVNHSIQSNLDGALSIRNQIIRANLRLIVSLAKSLGKTLDQMSDLISEGMMPLIRSVELFDVGLGNRFSTYATWAIRNQMVRYLKRLRVTPEFLLGSNAPPLETLADYRIVAQPEEPAPQRRSETVQRILSSLSEKERIVLAARFGLEGHPEGQSLADIAQQVGLSKERVRQIVINSLAKLKEQLSEEEYDAIR